MDYQTLIEAWKKYPKKWDDSYRKSIGSGIWDDPKSYVEEKVQFLNDWLCRVDKKTAIPGIKKHSERFCGLLRELSSINLLNLNPESLERIKQAYDTLAEVNGLGPTAISKYLHMHKRDLFIMWENQIFRDYFHIKSVSKSTATSERYLKFVLRMRDEVKDVIKTFALSKNITEAQAVIELRKYLNDETLPRILDKYNFVTRGKPKQRIY